MCSITPQRRFWFQAGLRKNAFTGLAAAILAITQCLSESAKTIPYIAESFKHFVDHFSKVPLYRARTKYFLFYGYCCGQSSAPLHDTVFVKYGANASLW